MKFETMKFSELTTNYDKKHIPLSTMERNKRKGNYRYNGAQGVIDSIDDYIFDGKFSLIAEDRENLKSKKQNIAHIVQCNEKCRLEYLYFMVNAMDLSGYLTGSAQPKLSQANMNNIIFTLPFIEIQDMILSIVLQLERKIALNTKINFHLC